MGGYVLGFHPALPLTGGSHPGGFMSGHREIQHCADCNECTTSVMLLLLLLMMMSYILSVCVN